MLETKNMTIQLIPMKKIDTAMKDMEEIAKLLQEEEVEANSTAINVEDASDIQITKVVEAPHQNEENEIGAKPVAAVPTVPQIAVPSPARVAEKRRLKKEANRTISDKRVKLEEAPIVTTLDDDIFDTDATALTDFINQITPQNLSEDPKRHIYRYVDDSLLPGARVLKRDITEKTRKGQKANEKDRVNAFLYNPEKKIKKDLERRDVYFILLLISEKVNARRVLEQMHLPEETRKIVECLWYSLLPGSFTEFIHSTDNIKTFLSGTNRAKMNKLNEYFDKNLVEVYNVVKFHYEAIRLCTSKTFSTVYYLSNEGIKVHNDVSSILRGYHAIQPQNKWPAMTGVTPYASTLR